MKLNTRSIKANHTFSNSDAVNYYIYQKMIEQCISLYIQCYINVLYYHVYIVYDLNHPRSSKFGRMVKLSSSVSNSNFFWKQLTQHLGFSSLATHREGRWSRRCVAAKHHTGPLAVGWLKTLEITVRSCPVYVVCHVYLVIPAGNTWY